MLANISVIIPVYNAEFFLRKAVESALALQEVGEVILVEDSSPDNALMVCKQLLSEYKMVKLLQHPGGLNRGAGSSRNLGITNALFTYIAFLDADDYYLPNRFKKDKEVFMSDKSIEGVYNAVGPFAIDDEGQNRMNSNGAQTIAMHNSYSADELFEKMEPIGASGFFHLDGLTLKKSAIEKSGLMNMQLALSQDTHFCIKLAAVCKLMPGELKCNTALYGVHQNNRCQFPEKLTFNRPYLFYDLYKWGISKKISQCRIYLLWHRFYQYHLLVNKPNRQAQLMLLFKEGINNPFLFKSSFFLKQLPLLHRIIS